MHYELLLYILIIRTTTKFVRSTIHTPSDVQQETPTEHGCHKPRINECLIPQVHGYNGWEDKAR